jgi:hypothetical protein
MVLQDLGRRINAAVSNLTREQNLDEKVGKTHGVFQPRHAWGRICDETNTN